MSVDILASLATIVVPILLGIVVLIVILRIAFRR
jgi:hypothetical protein